MTNEEWIGRLSESGAGHEAALGEPRTALLRGLRASLGGWSRRVGREFDSLVEDFAQEAILKILDNLDSFRSESKFTTWAMKIAIRIALTELRRKRWQNFSLDQMMETGGITLPEKKRDWSDPEVNAERKDAIVFNLINEALTEKQRKAIMAIGVKGVPLDVLAERMETNRNALYKLIHDARLKLKAAIEERGLSISELLAAFEWIVRLVPHTNRCIG